MKAFIAQEKGKEKKVKGRMEVREEEKKGTFIGVRTSQGVEAAGTFSALGASTNEKAKKTTNFNQHFRKEAEEWLNVDLCPPPVLSLNCHLQGKRSTNSFYLSTFIYGKCNRHHGTVEMAH